MSIKGIINLLLLFAALLVSTPLKAQEAAPQRITLNAQNPSSRLRAYVHHFEADTLWMISDLRASPDSRLQAFAADRIFSLQLPDGPTRRGNNAGTGFLIGGSLGLLLGVGFLTSFDGLGAGSSLSSSTSDRIKALGSSTLLFGLGGGFIGALIPKKVRPRSRILIEGRSDRLNAQRERLRQIQIAN